MVDVARERFKKGFGEVAGHGSCVGVAFTFLRRMVVRAREGRKYRDPVAVQVVGLARCQGAHLDMELEHGPVQLRELSRERDDIAMGSGVTQEGREARIGMPCADSWQAIPESRRISNSLLEVLPSLGGNRLHNRTQTERGLRECDTACAI